MTADTAEREDFERAMETRNGLPLNFYVQAYQDGALAGWQARAALPARAPEGLRIVFDGMPGPEGPRFVEVEDATGHSVNAGDWRTRPDGLCELVLKTPPDIVGLLRRAVALIKDAEKDTNWTADSWTTPEADCFVAVAERALSASPAPGPAEPVARSLEAEPDFVAGIQGFAAMCESEARSGGMGPDDCNMIAAKLRDVAFVVDQLQKLRDGKIASGWELRPALTQPASATVAGGEA